jgi:hypothetical protein
VLGVGWRSEGKGSPSAKDRASGVVRDTVVVQQVKLDLHVRACHQCGGLG